MERTLTLFMQESVDQHTGLLYSVSVAVPQQPTKPLAAFDLTGDTADFLACISQFDVQ